MSELYIGLMSGTSVDGIDAALVDFSEPQPKLLGTLYQEYSSELRQKIVDLCQPGLNEINRLGELDVQLGKAFASISQSLLKNHAIEPAHIRAIGSHGQTIRHHPAQGFTLQIGDPNIIAAETGITTIADFRRRDIAWGGQGAPLVPAFHQTMFTAKDHHRIILNIGGIANITVLPTNGDLIGFDTGPGNTLLDAWMEKHCQKACDHQGAWAATGKINQELLANLLDDPFFKLTSPKSTGREYFNLAWLETFLTPDISPVDVQTTLVELTARSILAAAASHISSGEIFVCGGGVHNDFLMQRLHQLAASFSVQSTQSLGIDPNWVEAMAFAWLAKQTLEKKTGNIKAVTGAKRDTVLGGVYF